MNYTRAFYSVECTSKIIYFAIIAFGIMPSIHLFNVVLKLVGGDSSKGFSLIFLV